MDGNGPRISGAMFCLVFWPGIGLFLMRLLNFLSCLPISRQPSPRSPFTLRCKDEPRNVFFRGIFSPPSGAGQPLPLGLQNSTPDHVLRRWPAPGLRSQRARRGCPRPWLPWPAPCTARGSPTSGWTTSSRTSGRPRCVCQGGWTRSGQV